ncbi:regulatory LuxR family protein [Lentzea atacamensis]|uniref:Regulatory LuxR family protein n=1 Tax=Lentzea atacamensis TaxID=531938 RepID=A0A316HU47_9PSEU|nr:regulatory LuxR family protein [Lentzea atacamensis]
MLLGLFRSVADLTARDLRRALDLVHEWNDDDTLPTLDGLGRLVGCDTAGIIGSDHVARRLTSVHITRPERNLLGRPGFVAAVAHHPAFTAYRSGRLSPTSSVALTDLEDRRSLLRLPLYADFYRPEGTVDQLLRVVRLNGRRGSVVVFNRSRPSFSRRDRAVVDLLAPHLSHALVRRERLAALVAAARHATLVSEQATRSFARLPELTPRERHVAVHVADGSTDREIARNLSISPRTVHKHLEQIYRKLGLTNRASLAVLINSTSVDVPETSLSPQPD